MSEKIVVMTEAELEELVFKAASKACSNLYNGLAKQFLYRQEDDMKRVLFELEELKH